MEKAPLRVNRRECKRHASSGTGGGELAEQRQQPVFNHLRCDRRNLDHHLIHPLDRQQLSPDQVWPG